MATKSQVRLVESEDGRRLRVEVAGDGDRVVLAQTGTPNAGVLFEPWVANAAARRLRLVTYDRPGYGGSSAQPGRTVADCVTTSARSPMPWDSRVGKLEALEGVAAT